MINIDKEIQKLKNIELEKQEKLDKEKKDKSFLNIDRFNDFLENDDSLLFYNFITYIKNCKKSDIIPVFYNSCDEINKLLEYVSNYLSNNKVSIIKGFFDKIIERFYKNDSEKSVKNKQIRLIILDNSYDKSINYDMLTELFLNEKINWYFILKSYTKNLSQTLFTILNLKKKWKNDYKIYEFIHNFDIYHIKIYTEILEDIDLLIFEINYVHFFKIKFTNIIKILEFFKEGLEMNSAILHFNDNFSMSFDDKLFSICINSIDITSKLQFYNSTILRSELNNFIIKNKKKLCILN